MRGRLQAGALLALALAAVATWLLLSAVTASAHRDHRGHEAHVTHVLLISVDGLHQSDLNWYVQNHPNSEPAKQSYLSVKTQAAADFVKYYL